jgi:nucleolar protein TMA23
VTNTVQSTLNQIRTKGINRGGLYGFFVKGEAIAGTLDDSSASATDTSNSLSLTDTPPTSASEANARKPTTLSDETAKRKRGDDDAASAEKAAKKARKEARKQKVSAKTVTDPVQDSDAADKLAKKPHKEARKQKTSTEGESRAVITSAESAQEEWLAKKLAKKARKQKISTETPAETGQDDAAEKLAKKARKEARKQKQDSEGAAVKRSKKARVEAHRARKADKARTQDDADAPTEVPQAVSAIKQERDANSTKEPRVKQETTPPADSTSLSEPVQDPATEKEQASKARKAARREARKADKASSGNGKLAVKHAEN